MSQLIDPAIDRYVRALQPAEDAYLRRVRDESLRRDVPLIDAQTGALLRLLTRAPGARRGLGIRTGGGYSALWIAPVLPSDAMLITIEANAERAAVARINFEEAGVAGRTSVIIGEATRFLHKVRGPFDLIFQDGDKALYAPLLDRLVSLLRPGGLLITDNVLWDGEVVPGFVDPPRRDQADTRAIAEYNERLNRHPQLMTITMPLRDGVAISLKRSG